MATLARLNDEEVQLIAEATLGRELNDVGFEDITTESGPDQNGDAAIFVTLNMRNGTSTISGRRLADAHAALVEATMAQGEDRHTYLRVSWPGEEIPPSLDESA